jgi:hypothetical protein
MFAPDTHAIISEQPRQARAHAIFCCVCCVCNNICCVCSICILQQQQQHLQNSRVLSRRDAHFTARYCSHQSTYAYPYARIYLRDHYPCTTFEILHSSLILYTFPPLPFNIPSPTPLLPQPLSPVPLTSSPHTSHNTHALHPLRVRALGGAWVDHLLMCIT